MRDNLRATIAAEKDELFRALDAASDAQRAVLLEEIAACDSLLKRIGPPCGIVYQIRDQAPRNKPPVKCEAGRQTDSFIRADRRGLRRGL